MSTLPFRHVALSLVFFLVVASVTTAQERATSYPISLDADDVHEIANLKVELNGLTLTGKNILAVPIRCEPGITGVTLLGDGTFTFVPKNKQETSGAFRAAMLRFNPADQPALISFDADKAVTDHAAHEMSRHLLNSVFRHCWHSGMEALIPDAGTLAANVYSKQHGDLLISTGSDSFTVYNFTKREQLYASK